MTGDVVNTASRLQGAAPVDGIAVSEQTYRQTERVFDYEELEPVQVKGKTEPLALYRPLTARARFGTDVTRTHTAPLVGRELEKPLLIGTFERSAQQRSCQLVTIVGEPGVGKSRLCAELFGYLEDRPGLVRWRQGRSLPYGEGIAFWALGEIVKAECGILDSDSPDEAEAKLEQALPADEPDRPWLLARLSPLVGAGGEPASQEESFTAWRRFLESLAEWRETILVFEDLHWADEALLSFLEHLADWSQGVPLLILCTARPELHEQHPTWAAGLRNATTINLAPLSDEDTARLIGSLLERAVLPAETQRALLERAGGNPLYAEEFVRLLADRDLLSGRLEDVQLPDSVQALIAARLDTLSPERKSLLQDAAVIGKVFWSGALAEMGDRELARGRAGFARALAQGARAPGPHELDGGRDRVWLLAPPGQGRLLRADPPRCPRRPPPCRRLLARAQGRRARRGPGRRARPPLPERARARSAPPADAEQARELEAQRDPLPRPRRRARARARRRARGGEPGEGARARPGRPPRARLRCSSAGRRRPSSRAGCRRQEHALEEALALYREQGDERGRRAGADRALACARRLGDPRQEEALTEALALLEAQPPGPELVAAYAQLAGSRFVGAAYGDAIAAAERALALAAELGLPEPAHALGIRGGARAHLGERQGLEDMRRALALALEQGEGRVAARPAQQPRGRQLAVRGAAGSARGLPRGDRLLRAARHRRVRTRDRRHERNLPRRARPARAGAGRGRARWRSAWKRPATSSPPSRARCSCACSPNAARTSRPLRGRARRDGAGERRAADDRDRVRGRRPAPARPRPSAARRGRCSPSSTQAPGIRADPYSAAALPELVRTALALGERELAVRLADGVEPRTPLDEHAARRLPRPARRSRRRARRGGPLYAEAAERWRTFGNVPERAYALLGQGRCLAALGNPKSGVPLREARDLFASMGFAPAVAEADALLRPAKAAAL